MSAAVEPTVDIAQSAPVPRLLVELPSWRSVFLANLRDLAFPRRQAPLELRSAPAAFWPDVFVKRRFPWNGIFTSVVCHVIAFGVLIGISRLIALQPQVVTQPVFDHSQVIYYDASQYLPPLDTRSEPAARPQKADPEFSRQPIISVPAEADNRTQTIVTPPKVKLKNDVALPNIVAWSDAPKRPRLDIPPAPLTPAADIARLAPKLEDSVVTPPPDAARLAHRRDSLTMQNSVVAPPPELHASNASAGFAAPQPSIVAPPPSLEGASSRRLGDINIGRSAVIAPAPQLPVAEQRAVPSGRMAGAVGAPQVVPPPPSLGSSGSSGASFGSQGRVIALNLHPSVGAPPDPPAGNRRGTFAATPEGHAGASGSPGASAGTGSGSDPHGNGGKENGSSSTRKGSGDLPAGLYIGNTTAKTSPVAGDPAAKSTNSVNPNLLADARPPRVTSAPARTMQPDSAAKLSDAERTVFGNRRFYSINLNMPNLNSAGGSWIIRFAELKHDSSSSPSHDAAAPAPDLSQPMATRKVDPAYPLQLMRQNVQGTVILYAVIHADGSVGNVRVLRSVDERLDRFASEAVAKWTFEPATKNGAPVDVEATFVIPFRPSRLGSSF